MFACLGARLEKEQLVLVRVRLGVRVRHLALGRRGRLGVVRVGVGVGVLCGRHEIDLVPDERDDDVRAGLALQLLDP